MSATREFFEKYLPNKFQTKPDVVTSINAVYRFDIQGAGSWTVDLTQPGGDIHESREGEVAGCTITINQDNFENMLKNPALAMQLFMTQKLKASNMGLAMQLQKLLG